MKFNAIFILWLFFSLLPVVGQARELAVKVMSPDREALADVVVYAEPGSGMPKSKPLVMDQQHKTFVPFILPVQVGTWVDFPNSDSVNHHVYSFSPAKHFELKLFKGESNLHSVQFDKEGVVVLGCNIHDWMLGYIVVVNTPWFSQTNSQGVARLNLPDDREYKITIWHPRIADDQSSLQRNTTGSVLEFDLQKPLKPDPRRSPSSY